MDSIICLSLETLQDDHALCNDVNDLCCVSGCLWCEYNDMINIYLSLCFEYVCMVVCGLSAFVYVYVCAGIDITFPVCKGLEFFEALYKILTITLPLISGIWLF